MRASGRYVGAKAVVTCQPAAHAPSGPRGPRPPRTAPGPGARALGLHVSACVSSPNPAMPPERRSRTKPERRRTGSRPGRKIRMKPGGKAGAGPGGPPRKAAYSSQRKPPAGPRAAAAAIAIAAAAAAEESRLRELHRSTLEEDKPAVERCLEELVFGDVAGDEDALLRRLRGPRVREAAARGLGALGRGARWAANLRRRSLGDLRRRGDPGGREGASGRTRAPRGPRRKKVSGGRIPRRARGRGSGRAQQPARSTRLLRGPQPGASSAVQPRVSSSQGSSLGLVRSPGSVPCGGPGVPLGLWDWNSWARASAF